MSTFDTDTLTNWEDSTLTDKSCCSRPRTRKSSACTSSIKMRASASSMKALIRATNTVTPSAFACTAISCSSLWMLVRPDRRLPIWAFKLDTCGMFTHLMDGNISIQSCRLLMELTHHGKCAGIFASMMIPPLLLPTFRCMISCPPLLPTSHINPSM